jgi:hypothetical protein
LHDLKADGRLRGLKPGYLHASLSSREFLRDIL